ncbi:FG-GAP-like repeat-containing protein [Marinobacteraceae bacterium S3BR75-40.1]
MLLPGSVLGASFSANDISGDTGPSYGNCTGDFDRDGDVDLYVLNYGKRAQNLLWINDGSGNFTAKNINGDTGYSGGCAVGDVDNDGDLDLYVGNDFNGQNRLWLNDGAANFTNADIFNDKSSTVGVAMGDVDGDGDLDLYAANGSGTQNKLWINDGSGLGGDSFTASDITGDTGTSYSAVMADVDNDGDLDIYTANHQQQNRLWINDGLGDGGASFTAADIAGDTGSTEVPVMGDVDGDGDLDIYVPNRNNEQNKLWLNDGNGSYTASDISGDTGNSVNAAMGDIDLDGDLDIYTTNDGTQNKLWINDGLGNGGASFTASDITGDTGDSQFTVMADFDGDGDLDIHTTNQSSTSQNRLWINNLAPFAASFTAADISTDADNTWNACSGDLDNDGDIDLYVPNEGQQNRLWLNNGDGTFSNGDITGDLGDSTGCAIGDVDKDGDLDIHVANWTNEQNKLWINDGSASFTAADIIGDDYKSEGSVMGDVDGDGDLDIYVANNNAQNKLWINDGNGSFSASDILNDQGISFGAFMGDVDRDGDLDIYVTNHGGQQNRLWINDGSGVFSAADITNDTGDTELAQFADIDSDGDLDLYVANRSNQQNRLWLNDGSGNFSASDISGDTGDSVGVAIGDVDRDGDLDIYVTNDGAQNKLWINDGTGSGGGSFSASDITGDTGASQGALLADFDKDGDLDIYTTNQAAQNKRWENVRASLTAGAASAGQTQIYVSASTRIADGSSTATITVQARDANGVDLSSGGDTILLSQSGSATLSGVTDNGDGTYTATLTNTVAEAVTVSGTLNGSGITDTATVVFEPGPADETTTLVSVTPSALTADGSTATITVQTRDANGNALTTGGDTVALSQSGSASIVTVTDNGDGTYSASISSTLAETVTLSGSLNGVAITDTATLTFNPGAAASSTSLISASPATVTADGTIATVTVQAVDANGNNLTTGGDTIALSQNGSATLGNVTDNGDGTYTAAINSTVAETVTVSGTLNGSTISDTASVTFTPGIADPTTTRLNVSSSLITADGTVTTVTVQAIDANGNPLTSGGDTVTLAQSGSASLSGITDNGDGTYTASLSSSVIETVTVTGLLNGVAISDTATVEFTSGTASSVNSILVATPTVVTANGADAALITLQLIDTQGNALTSGGDAVSLSQNGGATLSRLTDHGDGTYSASLTSSQPAVITITGTVNGTALAASAEVTFVPGGQAQSDATDGQFVSGTAPAGATIAVRDGSGTTLCSTSADLDTGAYHCLITTPLADGETLTVAATDLAGHTATSSIIVNRQDSDGDGVSDVMEDLLGTDKLKAEPFSRPDSDGDGLPDYHEVILNSDPASADSPVAAGDQDDDVDGLSNALEFYFNAAGGAADSELASDTDGDGIADLTELLIRGGAFNDANRPTPAGNQDTDGDGVTDAVEAYLGRLAITPADATHDYDRDGYSDALEVRLAANPLRANEADRDNDGISDAIEAFLTGTIDDGLNSALRDRDLDGLADRYELTANTDLNDPAAAINHAAAGDSDGDGISDAVETYLTGSATGAQPNQDSDGDSLTDLTELGLGSDPLTPSKPVAWITVTQTGSQQITARGHIGGFQSPAPDLSWDLSDIRAKAPAVSVSYPDARSVVIDGLPQGSYRLSLTLTRALNSTLLSSDVNYTFLLADATRADTDHDGVIDAYDVYDGEAGLEESLQTALGSGAHYALVTDTGTFGRLGMLATLGDNVTAQISAKQLEEYAADGQLLTRGDRTAISDITSTPNLFDLEAVNLPAVGSTVSLSIPLHKALPTYGTLLVFHYQTRQWTFFNDGGKDRIRSYAGAPDACAAPGDSRYTAGLVEGDNCLEVRITDGGPNDADGRANGRIATLLGVGASQSMPQWQDYQATSVTADPVTKSAPGGQTGASIQTDSGGSGGGGALNLLSLLMLFLLAATASFRAGAAPQNGTIVTGSGGITANGALTTITQDSDRLAIQWDAFDIAAGETVQFVQPNGQALALNVDFSGSASQLLGTLNANGQVLLLNRSGILIGDGASINTSAFLASDLSVSPDDFASGDFTLTDNAPKTGGIVNRGQINTTGPSGIYVLGQFFDNSGQLSASNGDIHVAIADKLVVTTDASGLLGVQLTEPLQSDISPTSSLIANKGSIVAFDGNIYLDLIYSDVLKAQAVNNQGMVNAVGITQNNGRVVLTAQPVATGSTLDTVASESLVEAPPEQNTLTFELDNQAKPSLDAIMPSCENGAIQVADCRKYTAIKRYLGRLLLGGSLPD